MKKKIGIMTFHASNNSGSMLQAYALQHFFRGRYKIDTEIIDYSNEVQQRMYSILCKPKTFKDLLRDILYLSHYKSIARTEKGYDEFKKYYKLSKKYRKSEDLKIDESEYLAIIAGSDQVWNINAMDFDENYMLPFKNIKKIATLLVWALQIQMNQAIRMCIKVISKIFQQYQLGSKMQKMD